MHESIDVKLTPLGFFCLLHVSAEGLIGEYVEPGELFGRDGRHLEERLYGAHDWNERHAVLDHLLLERTSRAISIDTLAGIVGYSRRHLTGVFRAQVGLAPKTVARLLRFRHACQRMRTAPATWADIAAESGYYDQSHLNRDFRELAGTTPEQFIAGLTVPTTST